LSQGSFQFINVKHSCSHRVVCLRMPFVERGKCVFQKTLADFLILLEFGDSVFSYRKDVVLKFLIAYECVMASAEFSVVLPSITGGVLFAIPAEFKSLSLHCTSDERASNKHSPLALASAAPALSLSMIARAESTGKTANSDLTVPHSYGSLLQQASPKKYAGNQPKRRRGIRAPCKDARASENHAATFGLWCERAVSNIRLGHRMDLRTGAFCYVSCLPTVKFSTISAMSVPYSPILFRLSKINLNPEISSGDRFCL